MDWVKHFNKHTYNRFKSVYCLLILNNYKSYYLNDFEEYYKDNKILMFCMFVYFFHFF